MDVADQHLTMAALETYQATEKLGFRDRVKRKALLTMVTLGGLLSRGIVAENLRDGSLEELVESNRPLFSNPYILGLEHNDWNDFLTIGPDWFRLPGLPALTVVVHDAYIPVIGPKTAYLNTQFNKLLTWAGAFQIKRVSHAGQLSDDERRDMQAYNSEQAKGLLAYFARNLKLVTAPQGTTKRDGTTLPIRKGIARYAGMVYRETQTAIPTIILATRYDFLSGRKRFWGKSKKPYRRRQRRFFRRWVPEPVYNIGDDHAFMTAYEHATIENRTITVGDLATVCLYNKIANGQNLVSRDDFSQAVATMVGELKDVDGIYLDQDLLRFAAREIRLDNCVDAFLELGYFTPEEDKYRIHLDVLQKDPFALHDDRRAAQEHYKETNIALWTYHGIQELALHRWEQGGAIVGDALARAGFTITDKYSSAWLQAQRDA
jgi:hypothetical protein